MRIVVAALALTLAAPLLAVPLGVAAQEPANAPLRVFLDCQTFGCDQEFIRSELTWVDWVADRQTADVHMLITSQDAGGGGERFTLDLLGAARFAGQEQHLFYASSGGATEDEVREGLLDRMALGLVPFAVGTPAGDRLEVSLRDADDEEAGQATDDPWNFWVFTIGVDGNLDGESRQRSIEIEGSAEAERTTELWRFRSGLEVTRNEEEFELSSGRRTTVTENWELDNFAVRGVADHWAVGVNAGMGRSTRFNQDFYATFAPGIEFSVFPYTEFSRRALTVQYLVGAHHFSWTDTTIYGHTRENRLNHSLNASLDLVQPWGEVDVGVTGSHYFHRLNPVEAPDGGQASGRRIPWRIDLGGRLEVRLFRGFFVNFGGNYQWIRDQLHIPKEDLDDEDILLELQQLATDFSYETFFGISYRFGSIFSGAVNPRFGGGGGGGDDDDDR
jgi:hypothetical protein